MDPWRGTGDDEDGILCATLNQDSSCVCVGTSHGFRVLLSDPLREVSRRESPARGPARGGIGLAAMLWRTNIVALVGGGRDPRWPPNRAVLWDDERGEVACEIECGGEVRGLALRRDCFVIALNTRVMVYTLSASPVRLHSFDTAPNPRGTFALSLDPHPAVLAFPARVKGQVAIVDLSRSLAEAANGTRGQTPAATLIAAHTSRITCLALSPDGSRLASASEKGTLIRVFDTRAGRLVAELRRGVDRVELYTVAFNPAGTRLCVTSDKGTVHVFNLISTDGSNPVQSSVAPDDDEFDPADPEAQWPTASAPNGPLQTGNRQSHLSFLPLRYFSSSWSFARFSVPGELRCIAGFIPSAPTEESLESLLIVCMDGGVYKVAIDPEKGGDCAVQWFSRCWRPTSGGKWTGVDEHEFFQGMAVLNPSEKPQNEKEWVPDRRKPSSEKGDRGVEKIYPKVEELPAVDSNGSPYATEAMRNALEETMSTPTLRQGGPPQGQDGKARKNPPASANPKSLSASVPAPIPKRTKPESNKRPSMGKLMLVERVDDWETDF